MEIKYVQLFDELYWSLDVDKVPCYYCKYDNNVRDIYKTWIHEYCTGTVYIWSGGVLPDPGSSHWDRILFPVDQVFFIFMNKEDEAIFRLTFLGDPILKIEHFTSIQKAYSSRKSRY